MLSSLKLYALGAVGLLVAALSVGLWYYHGRASELASELATEKAYSASMERGYDALSSRYQEQTKEAETVGTELDAINRAGPAGPVPDPLSCAIGVCK